MLCCRSQFFGGTGLRIDVAVRLDRKMVVAMLAEIFMVRSEAQARLVEEVLPSSTSRFIPFSPRSKFTFKETDPKGGEAANKERPVRVVR